MIKTRSQDQDAIPLLTPHTPVPSLKELENISPFRRWKPKVAWLDGLVIFICLASLNLLFAPDDMGWRKVNPSPFIFLPLLMGCRYGFNAGILGGFAACLPFLANSGVWHQGGIREMLLHHGFYFSALILTGGVCGEIQYHLRLSLLKLERESENQQSRMRSLNEETEFLRAVNLELERMLATRDSELSTLDSELRRLFDSEPENLYQDFLFLLSRQCRVSDAAVYLWNKEGESLSQRASIGNHHDLPTELDPQDREMIALSARRRDVVALPETWTKTGRQKDDFLLVIPMINSESVLTGFLVVQDMPFISFEPSNIKLIHLITKWAVRIIEVQEGAKGIYRFTKEGLGQRIFYPDYFKKALDLAIASYHQNRLPSAVVTFQIPHPQNGDREVLESQIMKTMRNGDFPSILDCDFPNLAVLLPLSSDRGASVFVKRMIGICNHSPEIKGRVFSKVHSINAETGLEELWKRLHELDHSKTV